MKYVEPLTEKLTVTKDGNTFEKTIYKKFTSLSGVTDEDYPIYDDSATYNTGDYVIVDELKTIYRCAADNTSGKFPPAYPDLWVDYGFVNSYKMLSTDEQIGSQTTSNEKDITLEFEFNSCDSIGIINVRFVTLKIEEHDEDDNLVYEKEISGRDYGADDFNEYFYSPFGEKTRIILTDLVWLPQGKLKLTFSRSNDAFTTKIGTIVMGLLENLGVTLTGSKLGFQDKSKIQTDTFTNTRKVVRYGHIREIRAKILTFSEEFNTVADKINMIIGKNVLFVPTKNEKFLEMTNIAYIENADLPIENCVVNDSNLTLIGVI